MPETKKCEHCGREVNVKSRICPFCSGEIRDPVDRKLSPTCPRCSASLKTQTHEGEDYHFCPNCGGLWLDRETLNQATQESTVYKEEDAHKRYLRGAVKDAVKYIPCVRCGKLMNRKNFARISGVIIDECGSHGAWLDPGELEKIRLFIVNGGLEKAQDKKIEKTAMELKDLAKKVDQTSFMQRLLHFCNFKRWLFGG